MRLRPNRALYRVKAQAGVDQKDMLVDGCHPHGAWLAAQKRLYRKRRVYRDAVSAAKIIECALWHDAQYSSLRIRCLRHGVDSAIAPYRDNGSVICQRLRCGLPRGGG
jgi:hypothetical protein